MTDKELSNILHSKDTMSREDLIYTLQRITEELEELRKKHRSLWWAYKGTIDFVNNHVHRTFE